MMKLKLIFKMVWIKLKIKVCNTEHTIDLLQFRVIPLVLALLYGNCPVTFKLNRILTFSRGCHQWRCYVKSGALGGFVGVVGTCRCCACGFVDGRLHHGCFSGKASDSLNFDILRGQFFFYSVSFVICIYLNCVTNQTFCKLFLLFNVRNIFFLLTYLNQKIL